MFFLWRESKVCVRALVLHFHHTCRFFVWPEVCVLLVRLMFVLQLNFLTTCAYFAASLCRCVRKNARQATVACVYVWVWRIRWKCQKPTTECGRGILAQAGHQMSEPARWTSDTFFNLKLKNRIWASRNKPSEGGNPAPITNWSQYIKQMNQ